MKDTSRQAKILPVISNTSAVLPRLDPEQVARALGADPAEAVPIGERRSVTMRAVSGELAARLLAGGGRAAAPGPDRSQLIPLSDEDWAELKRLADTVDVPGGAATPGQVASAILHLGIRAVRSYAAPADAPQPAALSPEAVGEAVAAAR